MPAESNKVSSRIKGASSKALATSKRIPELATSGWSRFHTKGTVVPLIRYEEAIHAVRPHVLSRVLWVIIIGFSIDDLLVMRVPSAWLALAGALILASVGGLFMGRRVALHKSHIRDDADFVTIMRAKRRVGQLWLIFSALAFVFWLMVFSSGVPPWAL